MSRSFELGTAVESRSGAGAAGPRSGLNPPLVSIVTPCLEPGERLARCLDSVADQSYPSIEHIVIDGGSSPQTVDLLRARGICFLSEPDRGQADALNKGFARASGVYLGWLNADDELRPGAVERVVEAFSASEGVGWVYGDCDCRSADGIERRLRSIPDAGGDALLYGCFVVQPGAMVARWALDQVGPLDDMLELAMDYSLWLRLAAAGVPAAYVAEPLALFEIHATSKTGTVEPAEFVVEEALALLRSGRPRYAALGFGRAAATAAQAPDGRVAPERLQREIARFTIRAGTVGLASYAGTLAAGARAQAAICELQLTPCGLRHLAQLELWRVPEARRQIAAALRRRLTVVLQPFRTRAARARRPSRSVAASALESRRELR